MQKKNGTNAQWRIGVGGGGALGGMLTLLKLGDLCKYGVFLFQFL